MLSGLSGRLLDMSARFPQLNYLIQKIAMRKRRDTGIIDNFRCLVFLLDLIFKLF